MDSRERAMIAVASLPMRSRTNSSKKTTQKRSSGTYIMVRTSPSLSARSGLRDRDDAVRANVGERLGPAARPLHDDSFDRRCCSKAEMQDAAVLRQRVALSATFSELGLAARGQRDLRSDSVTVADRSLQTDFEPVVRVAGVAE